MQLIKVQNSVIFVSGREILGKNTTLVNNLSKLVPYYSDIPEFDDEFSIASNFVRIFSGEFFNFAAPITTESSTKELKDTFSSFPGSVKKSIVLIPGEFSIDGEIKTGNQVAAEEKTFDASGNKVIEDESDTFELIPAEFYWMEEELEKLGFDNAEELLDLIRPEKIHQFCENFLFDHDGNIELERNLFYPIPDKASEILCALPDEVLLDFLVENELYSEFAQFWIARMPKIQFLSKYNQTKLDVTFGAYPELHLEDYIGISIDSLDEESIPKYCITGKTLIESKIIHLSKIPPQKSTHRYAETILSDYLGGIQNLDFYKFQELKKILPVMPGKHVGYFSMVFPAQEMKQHLRTYQDGTFPVFEFMNAVEMAYEGQIFQVSKNPVKENNIIFKVYFSQESVLFDANWIGQDFFIVAPNSSKPLILNRSFQNGIINYEIYVQ